MNLFRSEDHIARWQEINPESLPVGVIPLQDLVELFGTESRHHWLEDDYLTTWLPRRGQERNEVLARIGKATPYWGYTG
jgi:hypothetical protein